MLIFSVLNV